MSPQKTARTVLITGGSGFIGTNVAHRIASSGRHVRLLDNLLELIDLIGSLHGERPRILFEGWRTGDQRYYVSNTRRFEEATGWRPRVNVREGVGNLYNWLLEFRGMAEAPVAAGRHAS